MGRTAYRTCEQMSDPALQDGIGGQATGIAIALRFQELVDLRRGKAASARK
jgi:hypothetical protein